MTITIAPNSNSLEDWRKVYRGAGFSMSNKAAKQIDDGAAAVQAIIAKGEPVYGINTGFGKLASVRIGDKDLATLQRNLILSHSVGVGQFLDPQIVRLIAAIKIASLCHGASGARRSTIETIIKTINAGIIPAVPAKGSVGASGDLAPLAHFVAALMGVGELLCDGKAVPALDVLKANGIEPLVLSAKEGLALLNGTQVSTGLALAGLFEIETAYHASLVAGAMSLDGIKGTDVPFDERIHAMRPHVGQRDTAATLRKLIAGSEILKSHGGTTRVQDPYSFRCMPQVLGSCLDAIRHSAGILEIEAQSVSDNPLIFRNGDVLSGGNFHAEPTGFAADYLAIAAVEVGSISERRISQLLDSSFSGLPAFLTEQPGLNTGLMMGQITSAALIAESKQMAHPGVIDSIPTSANQEDHVSMSAHSAFRLTPMAENIQSVVAVELLSAAQACDFHAPLKSSEPLERVRSALREVVPHLDEDRWQKPELAEAINLVRSQKVKDFAGAELFPSI